MYGFTYDKRKLPKLWRQWQSLNAQSYDKTSYDSYAPSGRCHFNVIA